MYRITLLLLLSFYGVSGQSTKSPEEYFGYGYGKKFHFHHQIVEYAKYITSQNPNNTKLLPYGTTSEGRELFVVAFGSAENIQNLENIRKGHLQSIGLLEGTSSSQLPAISMLSYNIHGNEAVNSEVALSMLYELGKGNSAFANKVFSNSIVLIDPCANPDGLDRYSQWYNRHVGKTPNANPEAIEHREPWPGGRYNHYHFDMNRDLAWQTQHETQQRVQFYNSWMPHLHADFHEMGPSSSYFFAPSAKPFHEDFTSYQREFQNIVGDYNKRDFDKNGWLYYTKQRFDLLYPSYGDTYPSYNGAIGMTYEQGGSGVAGLAYLRTEGDTLTLEDRMKHTHSVSIAALEAIADHSTNVKSNFTKYFSETSKNGYGKYKSFVMKGQNTKVLTELLDKLQIRYSFANAKTGLNGFSYRTQKNENFSLDKDDLIVNTHQPKGIFAKILFDPHTILEDSNTYDITAWALPYAYGLEAFALTQKIEGNTNPTAVTNPANTSQNIYAYAVKPDGFESYRFMAAALQKGIKVRLQPTAFRSQGIDFPAGTLIFTKLGDQNFENKINQLKPLFKVSPIALASGMVEKGMDLGLDEVELVAKPNVAVLMGDGISATGFGDVWHYFDQQIDYPITLLDVKSFGRVKLDSYNVLILPSGRYGSDITESKALQNWIQGGGRLILVENACSSFEGKDGYDLKEKTAKEEKPSPDRIYGNAERESISGSIPGAIYEVNLDATHPLAFGYAQSMYLLIKNPNRYEYLSQGWNVGKLGAHKSGFVGAKLKPELKDVPVFAVQEKGRGKVIYLTESPIFRGFWYTGKALFANAVFFVK